MKALYFLPFLFTLFLFNCGQSSEKQSGQSEAEAQLQEGGEAAADAISQAEKAIKDVQGGHADVTPVPFRKLKELLPEELQGLPRTSHSGESTGAMGMKFSMAEARYAKDDKKIAVKLVDAGGIGIAAMSMAAWSNMELDREDDRGYERTSNWGSYKAYERCRTGENYCDFKLFSKEGIIVELEGTNISMDDLKEAASDLKINSIPGMRE
ncbi:MAG: hypothetical protein EP344_05290 [Bacteroidetes bacterium]|nr:MAG: hypothetical protein EP344_05290 [Bacteroidota bacterium]